MRTLKVGGKINLARRSQGLTIGAFAEKCRIPEGTMERICLRQSDPCAKSFFLIVTRGGVSLDIFDEEDWGNEGMV
jgi:hypothetical protein